MSLTEESRGSQMELDRGELDRGSQNGRGDLVRLRYTLGVRMGDLLRW